MDLILLLYGYSLGFTLLTLNMDVFNQNTLISTTLFCDCLHFGLFSSATNVIHPIVFAKKMSTKIPQHVCGRVVHFTNITMRRRCSCVVLGLSLAALSFYPRQAGTGIAPKTGG